MNVLMRAVVFAVFFTAVTQTSAVHEQLSSGQPVDLAPCARGIGRRIVSNLDIVRFHLPLFVHVSSAMDADYGKYYIRYGPKSDAKWLKFMLGSMVGGYSPRDLANTSIKWTSQEWRCSGGERGGTDWRGLSADGRKWRHIGITLSGFATYEGVPPKAAAYFDSILDTMCCGKCSYCNTAVR